MILPNAPQTTYTPKATAEPPSGEEAKAKAREMKSHEAEAKEKAQKDGKPITEEGPKPVNIAVPQIAAGGKAAGGEQAATGAKAAKKGEEPKAAHAAKKAETKADSKPAPAAGGAEKSVKSDVDAEIKDFLAKSPKDESKHQVHAQVQSLASGAQNLAAAAPPAAKGDGTAMSVLKAVVPGADAIGAKEGESDFGKIAMRGKNPYDEFDGKLKTWGAPLNRARNLISGVSSVLGKVGTVLTVVGLLISITGIGAPLGAPIASIGRVLGVITLILDFITFIMSGILTGLVAMELAKTPAPSPEMAQKLAGRLMDESSQTFQALLSVAMALPGLKKVAGMAAGGLKKIATGIGAMVGKFLGKVGLGAAKGLGKILAAGWNKLKASVFKSTLIKTGPGFLDKVKGLATAGTEKLGAAATKVKDFVGGTGSKLIDRINGPLEASVAKFEKSSAGKGLRWADTAATKFNETLEKATGKTLLDKGEKAATYYGSKLGAKADRTAESLAEGAEKRAGKTADSIEQSAQKDAQRNIERETAEAEKRAAESEAKGAKTAAANEPTASSAHEGGEPKTTAPKEGAEPKVGSEGEPKASGSDPAAGAKKEPGEDWKSYTEKREAELKRAADLEQGRSDRYRSGADERDAAKIERDTEKRNQRIMNNRIKKGNRKISPEKLEEQEAKTAAAEERFQNADKKYQADQSRIDARKADEEAAGRAEKRLNDARGGKNADGEDAKGLTDAEKAGSSEFHDATRYKDPKAETALGKAKELKEAVMGDEIGKSKKEATKDFNDDHNKEVADKYRGEADTSAASGLSLAAFGPEGGGEGGLYDKVHGMVGALDDAHDTEQHPDDKHDDGNKDAHKPADASPGPAGDTSHSSEGPQGPSPNPGPGAGGGEQQGAGGAIPYWPELLVEYKDDLGKLKQTREELKKYRDAQIAGYKAAVGIKDSAQEKKDKAVAAQPQAQSAQKAAHDDHQTLSEASKHANQTGAEAGKGTAKQGEAAGQGQQGAAAAGTEVPEPPAPHWYDHILNLAKKYIVNYLAKALKYVQDWFTDKIIQMFTGGKLNLEKVNEMSKGVHSQTGEDANKSQAAGEQAGQAGSKEKANASKADETMSEAQRLHDECKRNVDTADELLQSVDQVEKLVTEEISNGEKWLAELHSSKEKEKQELQAKDEEKQRQQESKEKAKEEATAAKADKGDKAKPSDGKDKDKASPEKVKQLHQAAEAVAAGGHAYHERVASGFQSAKSTLAQGAGNKQLNPAAAQEALQLFSQHGGDAVSHHQSESDQLKTKMAAISARGDLKKSEIHSVGGEVEGAAKEADHSMHETLGALRKAFESSYKLQHSGKAHEEGHNPHKPDEHHDNHAHA